VLFSTFQLGPGLGTARERRLWAHGVARWDEYTSGTLGLPKAVDAALSEALAAAHRAYAARDVDALASLLPPREHWRLFSTFGAGAAYLDIETCDDEVGYGGISAIGMLDRHGPRLLLGARELHRFPELARGWSMLVTFNGLSFDVPILRRVFPDWQPPVAHVDLRHLLPRLGHAGKLKELEPRLGGLHLARPAHLEGIGGQNIGHLFRRGREGDREALRRFAEYNLYDVIGLRTLMAYTHNGLFEQYAARAPVLHRAATVLPIPGRGDVLYDVSKILLSL
jgi:uncharacterized protein